MIFAGYNDAAMDEFVASNPGLFRRISSVFVFDAYQTSELAEILMLKIAGSGFRCGAVRCGAVRCARPCDRSPFCMSLLIPPQPTDPPITRVPLTHRLALPEDERLGVLHELIKGSTTALQRERMNGGICDHILRNAKRHLDARLTIDDGERMSTGGSRMGGGG